LLIKDDALRAQLSLAINPHSHAYGTEVSNNIDPQISSQNQGPGAMMMSNEAHAPSAEGDNGASGGVGKKRELSSSKRAAQNR
jgi:hypothetical protein